MSPYYQDNHTTIHCQDFRQNDLPDESVQMVVTSPPYWGLRKYSGEQDLIWGGSDDCEHEWGEKIIRYIDKREPSEAKGRTGLNTAKDLSKSHPFIANSGEASQGRYCQKCSAWRGSFGLEPTPEMYVQHTIEILREIRRVLRPDGMVFWNIGDSYAGSGEGGGGNRKGNEHGQHDAMKGQRPKVSSGLKPKDLCLIPFRVAIAAQEDKWWVRSIIIWSKPNPMPESVTDRPTESHEYILMLTKSARYYWDADAVREASTGQGGLAADFRRETKDHVIPNQSAPQHRLDREPTQDTGGRNLRSVWTFPTQPYPEAHFAVFPEKLPELCIKAATPEVGCCAACGAPWERMTEKDIEAQPGYGNMGAKGSKWLEEDKQSSGHRIQKNMNALRAAGRDHDNPFPKKITTGWQPTCKCTTIKPPVPSTVLDPFAGAGTTLWVAKKLNRKAIGFDTSEEYCQLTVERLRQQVML